MCLSCEVEKSVPEDFYWDGKRYRSRCKVCEGERQKAYYRKNRVARNVYGQRYRTEHAEKANATTREWNKRNRDHKRAYNRAYYQAKAEELRAYARAYAQAHYDEIKAVKDAKARGLEPCTRDSLDYKEILKADPCAYCGAPCEHIDHIVPVIVGGSNQWENLTAACASCNGSKQARSLLTFMRDRRWVEVAV